MKNGCFCKISYKREYNSSTNTATGGGISQVVSIYHDGTRYLKIYSPSELMTKEEFSFFVNTNSTTGGFYAEFPQSLKKNSYDDEYNLTYSYTLKDGANNNITSNITDGQILLSQGTYTLTYDYYSYHKYSGEAIITTKNYFTLTYTFNVIHNQQPAKKHTTLTVANRIFDLIIPLKYGQKPKFRLKGVIYDDTTGNAIGYEKGSLAEKLDQIIAPEFVFTKMNLREMLKQVGGYIHAEPRITAIKYDPDGTKWYEVGFDKYGDSKYSNIKNHRYVTATLGTDINEYCTHLDTSAENLVSQLDWAQGVVVEPFDGGSRTLRTENASVRFGENDSVSIKTDLPIYEMGEKKQVFCTYIPGIGKGEWDITPYIFEKDDYNNLSSYEGTYPFCKAYALYYTQGSPDIKGLFFMASNALPDYFHAYAIKNILEAVTGRDLDLADDKMSKYPELQFRVTYLPRTSSRIRTTKQTVVVGEQSTIPYNQGANLIETRFFGENLKGVIARLGNVEKTYTYNLAYLSDIPKVGTKFDKNYYISAVSTEILPFYIRCTVSLSKDFNRLSQYIGISSNKRMWEVSEKQSQQRESVYTEYVLITADSSKKHDENTIYSDGSRIAGDLFNKGTAELYAPVSCVIVRRSSKKNIYDYLQPQDITVPVVSTAMGNSMLFSFKLADNYSAGTKTVLNNGSYWSSHVPYGDYYGRFYWLQFFLQWGKPIEELSNTLPMELPQGDPRMNSFAWVKNDYPIKYRKDNREVPSITYELCAVTDIDGLIIGSGLMKNCQAVNASPAEHELWIFDEEINAIDSKLDFTNGRKVESEIIWGYSNVILPEETGDYKAWAIVTKPSQRAQYVEDEDGNEGYQYLPYGGELCIGQNGKLTGQSLYFRVKTDIYG